VLRECSTSRFIADAVLKWSTPPICKVTTLHEGNRYRRPFVLDSKTFLGPSLHAVQRNGQLQPEVTPIVFET
jgi:hypothetical protein